MLKKIIPITMTIMLTAGTVLAAAGHAEEYSFIADWLPRIVNFAILAAVLIIVTRKPVRDAFKARSAEIAKSIQESREARERAARALAEMEQKLKDLHAETERMLTDARVRGEKDKEALIAEGRKIAADIQAQVKATIDIEVQKAKTGLAVEASLLSIDLAEGRLKKTINAEDHERILKEYIDRMGGRG